VDKAEDSRWVHRAPANWDKVARRDQGDSVEGRIFHGLQHLIELRKNNLAFGGNHLEVINTDNDHVMGYVRLFDSDRLLVFANFSEQQQVVNANQLRLYGLSYEFKNLLNGNIFPLRDLVLEPYEFACLSP
jgi:amylosucrase